MKVWAIAVNTFREAVRNKILYALLLFALAMIVAGTFLGRLSLDQNVRIIQDFGLFSVTFFGMVIAVFVGVTLLYDEIQRRTIYVLLSKPIHRAEFVVGKYVGMLLTLLVQVVAMGATITVVLALHGATVGVAHLQALSMAYVELAVVTAVAVFFSSFSTPYLSGFFTFGVFVIGRLGESLLAFLPKVEPALLRNALWAATRLVPDLHRFDLTARVVYDRPLAAGTVALLTAYGVSYIAVVLLVAVLLFRRRDFL